MTFFTALHTKFLENTHKFSSCFFSSYFVFRLVGQLSIFHRLYGCNIKPKYLVNKQLQAHADAIPCQVRRLTDFSRRFTILFVKKTLSDNLWTCQSTGWQASYLHGSYRFQASEKNLYILSEYFRGSFLSFQADTELEHKLEIKDFLLFFSINLFSYWIMIFLHNYVRIHSYVTENRVSFHYKENTTNVV